MAATATVCPPGPLTFRRRRLQEQGAGRLEEAWVAIDDEGLEWLIAPHDDGTWNWFLNSDDATLNMGCDFATPADAMAAAQRAADT